MMPNIEQNVLFLKQISRQVPVLQNNTMAGLARNYRWRPAPTGSGKSCSLSHHHSAIPAQFHWRAGPAPAPIQHHTSIPADTATSMMQTASPLSQFMVQDFDTPTLDSFIDDHSGNFPPQYSLDNFLLSSGRQSLKV